MSLEMLRKDTGVSNVKNGLCDILFVIDGSNNNIGRVDLRGSCERRVLST